MMMMMIVVVVSRHVFLHVDFLFLARFFTLCSL
jgi:hypothetical protein